MPAARGVSGPTMVKSIFDSSEKAASPATSLAATGTHSAICAIPAFPGAQKSSNGREEFLRSAQISECSRPPDPTTSILIFSNDFPLPSDYLLCDECYQRSNRDRKHGIAIADFTGKRLTQFQLSYKLHALWPL